MRTGKSGPFQSAAAGISALVLTMGYANAHVTLAEPQAVPGAQYMAHFRVGHGCEGSPTVALRIELPPDVSAVTPQPQPGWTISTEREGSRIKNVTWTGGMLPPDKHGIFAVAMTLPGREGQLLFPARQTCQTGEEYWSEPSPAAGKAKHPAPVLTVGTAAPMTSARQRREGQRWVNEGVVARPCAVCAVRRIFHPSQYRHKTSDADGCGDAGLRHGDDAQEQQWRHGTCDVAGRDGGRSRYLCAGRISPDVHGHQAGAQARRAGVP